MEASVELIKAVFEHLKATPAVTDFVAQHIYDRVPEETDGSTGVPFPYVSLGPSSTIPDDFDCLQGEEITIQLDVWSSGSGEAFSTMQCRKICGAIKKSLHDVDLSLPTNALVTLQHEITRIIDDPNPAIHHGVIQFTATVETP
jgi:hypothetical protein